MPTQEEIQAGFDEARKAIDETGYGSLVDDARVVDIVTRILTRTEAVRKSGGK